GCVVAATRAVCVSRPVASTGTPPRVAATSRDCPASGAHASPVGNLANATKVTLTASVSAGLIAATARVVGPDSGEPTKYVTRVLTPAGGASGGSSNFLGLDRHPSAMSAISAQ